jgi:hypothetical protein
MKQQIDITLSLTFWIDDSQSKDQLTTLVESGLRTAFAKEIEEIRHPITILSFQEEAEIYSGNLPTRYDDYEIHGVFECSDDGRTFCEQVPDDEAQFWSLYGHIPGQGVDCIGDFKSRQHAEEVYARITGRCYAVNPRK